MKIRIGFGLGTRSNTNDHESFGTFVDALEDQGWDSLWVSERVSGESPDPMIAMAFAAGRTKRIKFGQSVMVLPGRNPVLAAKAIASLDRLSNGRVLPAFGLGVAESVGPLILLEPLGVPGVSQLKDLVAFSVLVLVLLFKPTGLFGERLSQEDRA